MKKIKSSLKLFTFSLSLLFYSVSSAQLVTPVWTDATSGTLNGIGFTITGFETTPSLGSWGFDGSEFSCAPLGSSETTLEYSGASDLTFTFNSPINDLKIYMRWWRPDQHLISAPYTLLCGDGAIVSNDSLIINGVWGNGILQINGSVTTLTITSNQSCCSFQALTFATLINPEINITSVSSDTLCPEESFTINYSTIGTFNAGNTFTAELSDETGSFASPTNIGSINGTSSGSINANIPGATTSGTGYRIRIISSDPVVTGSDNGNDLVIGAIPTVDFNSYINGFSAQFINNSTGAASWYWDFGDGNFSSDQNPTHTYSVVDTFNVCLTATSISGCEETTCNSVIVNPFVGIDEPLNSGLMMYPNPVKDVLYFNQTGTIRIMDLSGKVLLNAKQQSIVNLANLPSGIYMITFTDNSGQVYNRRIIKQ